MTLVIRKIRSTPCGGCDILHGIMFEIAGKIASLGATVVPHDISTEPEIQTQYDVMSVPVLVYEKDGVEVYRSVGVQPPEKIIEKILEINS